MFLVSTTRIIPGRAVPSFLSGRYAAVKVRKKLYVTLESDAIIELADGRWAALEIKTSERKADVAIECLRGLRDKLSARGAARVRPPEFMAVITGVSEYARRVEEGLYVIPITCPGA